MLVLDLEDARWSAFVRAHQEADPFHHPAWASLIAECYRYRAFAFCVTNPTGAIVGGVPVVEVVRPPGRRRWITLPFTDHCAPLVSSALTRREFGEELGRRFSNGDLVSMEIRSQLEGSAVCSAAVGFVHTLALQKDPSAVFAKFKRSQVQQPIVKAQRSGLVVRRAESLDEVIGGFYRLHVVTRRRLGVPVQPKRYFRLLWERLGERDLCSVLTAYDGEVPAAAALFLTWNGTMIYKYGASDPSLWGLRPNNLLLWEGIRWGCANGYRRFDFGRTDFDNEGLRKFKQGWGTDEQELAYSAIGAAPSVSAGDTARMLRPLIRHMPPWFCRALGAVAYRYAT